MESVYDKFWGGVLGVFLLKKLNYVYYKFFS